jgi:hypothetical protein
LKASVDVIKIAERPSTDAQVCIKSPRAIPSPVTIPFFLPPVTVLEIVQNTAGPGVRNNTKTNNIKVAFYPILPFVKDYLI